MPNAKPTEFYSGAREAWRHVCATGASPAREHGSTRFYPLPAKLRRNGFDDNRCCCRYCSRVAGKSDSRGPVWDTLAVAGSVAWLVHYPEINGRRPRRKTA